MNLLTFINLDKLTSLFLLAWFFYISLAQTWIKMNVWTKTLYETLKGIHAHILILVTYLLILENCGDSPLYKWFCRGSPHPSECHALPKCVRCRGQMFLSWGLGHNISEELWLNLSLLLSQGSKANPIPTHWSSALIFNLPTPPFQNTHISHSKLILLKKKKTF